MQRKKNQLVKLINSGLKDLNEEIKNKFEVEIENEDPESIVNIVEKFLSLINKIKKKDKL